VGEKILLPALAELQKKTTCNKENQEMKEKLLDLHEK